MSLLQSYNNNNCFILIVEDDTDISNMLRDLLQNNGYFVKCAFSGTEALLLIEQNKIDLVLLDLMLPGLSGEKVILKIRDQYNMPVIAVSALDDLKTKIDLLKSGADDYVTKPFDTDELLARIEAQLRRYFALSTDQKDHIVTYKDISLDTEAFNVFVENTLIPTTKREFMILELLMKNPKKVFTKDNIYCNVWNDEFFGDENTVNVHISNIRSKLAKVNPNVEYIQTVWGIGFKMWD